MYRVDAQLFGRSLVAHRRLGRETSCREASSLRHTIDAMGCALTSARPRAPLSRHLSRVPGLARRFSLPSTTVSMSTLCLTRKPSSQARDKYKKYNRNSTVTAALTEYANANQRLTYVYVSWCLFGQFTYSAVLSHCTNMHANAPAHRCKRSLLPFRKCIGMRRAWRCGDHRDLGDLLRDRFLLFQNSKKR